ncbi:uncharacterized protein AB9W97_021491 isoform 2-T2 [Spinachia spinachia]
MHRPPESDPGQFKVASRRALVLRRNRRTLGRLLVALHQGHARHPRSHHKATVTHRRSQRCAQEVLNLRKEWRKRTQGASYWGPSSMTRTVPPPKPLRFTMNPKTTSATSSCG